MPAQPTSGALAQSVLPSGNYSELTPAVQASTNATVVVTGSGFDARAWSSLAYSIKVNTPGAGAVTWSVWGASTSDYSDEVAVLSPVSVASAAASSYVVSPAPYAYYRVKIIDTVGNTHGTVTLSGIVKV